MPEVTDRAGLVGPGADAITEPDAVTERVLTTAGLRPLVAEAETVWRSRATSPAAAPRSSGPVQELTVDADMRRPVWHPFEDAFPTFYQFTNRPPR